MVSVPIKILTVPTSQCSNSKFVYHKRLKLWQFTPYSPYKIQSNQKEFQKFAKLAGFRSAGQIFACIVLHKTSPLHWLGLSLVLAQSGLACTEACILCQHFSLNLFCTCLMDLFLIGKQIFIKQWPCIYTITSSTRLKCSLKCAPLFHQEFIIL